MIGIGTTKRARLTLLVAAMLSALVGVGCGDEEEAELHPQLVYRQQLLADWWNYQIINPPPTSDEDCTTTLTQGSDPLGDSVMIRNTVRDAVSWDVICLNPGNYEMGMHMGAPIAASTVIVNRASNLTIKGIGDTREDVVLDFDGQTDGRGFDVSTPGFWIENMWIKNTKENGVEVKATNTEDNPNVFRKLRVNWDAGSVTENGAYSIYPTRSKYVIVEFNEVEGASDAGLYIGQVEYGIVRLNEVYGNVAGLEVENSSDVEVLGNAVYDNTGGILALQEPGLTRLVNERVLIRNNHVWENNRDNFASGGAVASVQRGTGMMAFGGTDIEFRDNTVEDNWTAGLLIASNVILDQIDGDTAPFIYPNGYNPYPIGVYEQGNIYTGNGTDPTGLIRFVLNNPPTPIEPIIWDAYISDGVESENVVGPGETEPVPEVFDPDFCFASDDPPVFVTLRSAIDEPKLDDLDLACDREELPEILFP